jgi:hypothetical protein
MPERIITKRSHLLQFNRTTLGNLLADYDAGVDSWWVNVDRNADRFHFDDLVFLWVSGPADKAGIVGCGVASGDFKEMEHPASYQEPARGRKLRLSTEIFWAWVGDTPVLTRAEMKPLGLFADFELFTMPNRPNAFTVNWAQAEFIVDRIKAVIGE